MNPDEHLWTAYCARAGFSAYSTKDARVLDRPVFFAGVQAERASVADVLNELSRWRDAAQIVLEQVTVNGEPALETIAKFVRLAAEPDKEKQ